MNQQLIFNNDFHLVPARSAVCFSCLVAGFKVQCFIAIPAKQDGAEFLQEVITNAFSWEDCVEQAIADDAVNETAELWL